jgi:single-strand DNA-binding protein
MSDKIRLQTKLQIYQNSFKKCIERRVYMNKVNLVGRLTKEVELRYTPNNNKAVAKFTIAVNRMFKQEGQPDADFLNVVVWGKPAENCGKYIGKGRLVAVSGRIETRSWNDQEGKKHFATDIVADEVHFLDKAKEGQAQEKQDFTPVDDSESDLPF